MVNPASVPQPRPLRQYLRCPSALVKVSDQTHNHKLVVVDDKRGSETWMTGPYRGICTRTAPICIRVCYESIGGPK
jgi:hypothetical protein